MSDMIKVGVVANTVQLQISDDEGPLNVALSVNLTADAATALADRLSDAAKSIVAIAAPEAGTPEAGTPE